MKKDVRRSGSQVNYTQRNYRQGSYDKRDYANSRKQYQELSSGYYMHTANAVVHDYQYEEEQQPVVRKVKKTKRSPVLAQHISTLFVVFILGFILVVQYAYIQNLGYQVGQDKAELKTVQEQNEKMKKQIAAKGELQSVESTAINDMGMRKPENGEIIYLPQTADNLQQKESTESANSTEDVVKNVLGTIMR